MINRLLFTFYISAVASLASVQGDEPYTYEIDPSHSSIGFKIRHFVNKVPGNMNNFKGSITFSPDDTSENKVEATIQAGSINTDNAKRDKHLRSEDYFHVEEYPEINFTSYKWEKISIDEYKVYGNLTMSGQTHPIILDVVYLGETEGIGPYEGYIIAGWEGTTVIDRNDWDISAGKPILGNDVDIEVSIQGHRKQEQEELSTQ